MGCLKTLLTSRYTWVVQHQTSIYSVIGAAHRSCTYRQDANICQKWRLVDLKLCLTHTWFLAWVSARPNKIYVIADESSWSEEHQGVLPGARLFMCKLVSKAIQEALWGITDARDISSVSYLDLSTTQNNYKGLHFSVEYASKQICMECSVLIRFYPLFGVHIRQQTIKSLLAEEGAALCHLQHITRKSKENALYNS